MNTHSESPKGEFRVMELPQSGKIQPRIIDPIYPPVTQSRSRLDSSNPGSKCYPPVSPEQPFPYAAMGPYQKNRIKTPDQKWNGIPNMLSRPVTR